MTSVQIRSTSGGGGGGGGGGMELELLKKDVSSNVSLH